MSTLFASISPDLWAARYSYYSWENCWANYNFDILGIQLDTLSMQMRLPQDKLTELRTQIQHSLVVKKIDTTGITVYKWSPDILSG